MSQTEAAITARNTRWAQCDREGRAPLSLHPISAARSRSPAPPGPLLDQNSHPSPAAQRLHPRHVLHSCAWHGCASSPHPDTRTRREDTRTQPARTARERPKSIKTLPCPLQQSSGADFQPWPHGQQLGAALLLAGFMCSGFSWIQRTPLVG